MSISKSPTCAKHRKGAFDLHADEGQALLESTVTFGLLIVLIVGIINFGFIFRTLISITNAANVGAMYAASSTTAANDLTRIRAAALAESTGWNCSNPDVARTLGTDGDGNPSVSVTVRCTVIDLIVLPSIPGEITVSHTAVRRIMP